ncbi:MAG: D-aminoacyl-tRNA deacylase [Oscillospiraceae bacterium]|nr:D-aminoacyl-tRNA deacylase [Oscillospiraceae bacterium]
MKAVVQRVARASVAVDEQIVGEIAGGLLVLLGAAQGDTPAQAELLAAKIAKLRVFTDDAGKMNRSVLDISGSVLVVSQFTLCADVRKGNRPAFTGAAAPDIAQDLVDYFCSCLQQQGVANVQTGEFGAHMHVDLLNDGPVTIIMDTNEWEKKSC